jgi:hypothetical protein
MLNQIKALLAEANDNEEGQGVYIGGGALVIILIVILLILLL